MKFKLTPKKYQFAIWRAKAREKSLLKLDCHNFLIAFRCRTSTDEIDDGFVSHSLLLCLVLRARRPCVCKSYGGTYSNPRHHPSNRDRIFLPMLTIPPDGPPYVCPWDPSSGDIFISGPVDEIFGAFNWIIRVQIRFYAGHSVFTTDHPHHSLSIGKLWHTHRWAVGWLIWMISLCERKNDMSYH